MGYISSVCSGGQRCAVLADQNVMGFISAIHELASRERHFYCWLSSAKQLLLTPLRNKGEKASVLAPSLMIRAKCCAVSLCICTSEPFTTGAFEYEKCNVPLGCTLIELWQMEKEHFKIQQIICEIVDALFEHLLSVVMVTLYVCIPQRVCVLR